MRYRYVLPLLGCALIVAGALRRDWLLSVIWLGGNFVALGIAYGLGSHRILGKRPDGTIARWSWLVFLPVLTCSAVVWHLARLLSRGPALNDVTDNLVVGRRLLASEAPAEFDNYVDLTAEFAEPSSIRRSSAYVCFPILDGGAPAPQALRDAVGNLRPGRTFVHCAQGYGRTGMFAAAVLLKSGDAGSVEEAMRILKGVRPGIGLSREQLECLQSYANTVVQSPSSRQTP